MQGSFVGAETCHSTLHLSTPTNTLSHIRSIRGTGRLRHRTPLLGSITTSRHLTARHSPHLYKSTRCYAAADSTGAAPSSASTLASSSSTSSSDPLSAAATRQARLQVLIQLRKLYRNLLRAEPLLDLPSPVYLPPEVGADAGILSSGDQEVDDAAALAAAQEEQRRIDEAVEIVAEMELTAEELRFGERALRFGPIPFGSVFKTGDPEGAEQGIQERVRSVYDRLVERAKTEIAHLPFPTRAQAQAAVDTRNARYRTYVAWLPMDGYVSDEAGTTMPYEQRRGLSERLTEAERVAEQFVSKRLQPAVQRVRETSPEGVLEGLKSSATYLKDVWTRLNGARLDGLSGAAPKDLLVPQSTEAARAKETDQLHEELEKLESQLQEASKARETRLRKAGIQGRARMASELREMDSEVAGLSRALAVRTLQLEAQFVFGALEAEALDILGDSGAGEDRNLALGRRGSSDEVALLGAEFKLLDEQLATLVAQVESGEALYIDDIELAKLATDLPDMRLRLGVGDTAVFGGTGFSITKLQLQIKQSLSKVSEGINFGTRGVRLLFQDVGSAGGLFWRALIGGTLRPREVQALRRTARDLLTFIPFIIILILPLTPVGHVLIFGFIQRYFPGFFPSQFTSKRQELMVKYEELKRQLQEAELKAEQENDEMAFQRAAAAAALAIEQRKAAVTVQDNARKQKELEDAAAAAEAAATAAEAAVAAGGVFISGTGGGSNGSGNGSGSDSSVLTSHDESGDDDPLEGDEGPAAKAVKKLEEQLAAAAEGSYTGDVEDSE